MGGERDREPEHLRAVRGSVDVYGRAGAYPYRFADTQERIPTVLVSLAFVPEQFKTSSLLIGRCGGTGRRAGLKIQ